MVTFIERKFEEKGFEFFKALNKFEERARKINPFFTKCENKDGSVIRFYFVCPSTSEVKKFENS